jgi:hypothetical protein
MRQSSLHGYFSASKRARPSDEIDMESLDALLNYLDGENIEHNDAMPLKHLQMLVARRMKRRASRERGETPPKPQPDAIETATTLRSVRMAMAKLSDDSRSTNDNLFAKASFVIDSPPDRELIKCKHHADWRKCRGNVEYGQCRQCRVLTPEC